MSGFDVDHDALIDAARFTSTAAARLRNDRDQIMAEVSSLLGGGWRGAAAQSFQDFWDDWVDGCRDVLDGLEAMSSLLAVTRLDYLRQDDESQRRFDQVAGAIVERLG